MSRSTGTCAAFLDRLDRRDAGVWEDPHPAGCASCRAQVAAARALDGQLRVPIPLPPDHPLEERSAAPLGAAAPPDGFAPRVAWLALLEARDRRRRGEARVLLLSRVTVVCSIAIAASLFLGGVLEQGRVVAEHFRLPPRGGLPPEVAASILLLLFAAAGRYAAHRLRALR
jgi:hypothetical protein